MADLQHDVPAGAGALLVLAVRLEGLWPDPGMPIRAKGSDRMASFARGFLGTS